MPKNYASVSIKSANPVQRIASALETVLYDINLVPDADMLVVCIGSDRATGDSLGPLVGSMLKWDGFPGKVLGTLDRPVHAGNLQKILLKLEAENAPVLGIDACLGTPAEVGTVIVSAGPLRPGLGVRKQLPSIGDLHIAGVVNVGGFMEHLVLQNTRLKLVMKMARYISQGVQHAIKPLSIVYPSRLQK